MPTNTPDALRSRLKTLLEQQGIEWSPKINKLSKKLGTYSVKRIKWHLDNGPELPKCLNPDCDEVISWHVPTGSYRSFCSRSCLGSNTGIQAKKSHTMLRNYGVEHALQSQEIKDRTRQTNLKRLGTEYASQSIEIKQKVRETVKERYGVDHVFQHPEFIAKSKSTSKFRYGGNFAQRNMSEQTKRRLKSKKWLNNQFIKGKSTSEIATKLGVADSTIIVSCKKLNVKIPKQPVSLAEREIGAFIKSLGLNYTPNVRSIITPQELDLYIETTGGNFAIEFDGLYWHSEIRHEKDYHLKKLQACLEKNITLIAIRSHEWEEKREQVKHRLMHILGCSKHKEYARKLTVKEVSTKDARRFLEKYHLQGYCGARIKIGLYKGDKLGAIMTFGKPRFNKEHEWELLRFASIPAIVGGASKLFTHFVRTQNPNSVISYSNNAFGVGSLYKNLNFEQIDEKIGYGYTKGGKFLSRQQCQKHKLIEQGADPDLTEREIMMNLGYLRVYDYGQKTWLWKNNL